MLGFCSCMSHRGQRCGWESPVLSIHSWMAEPRASSAAGSVGGSALLTSGLWNTQPQLRSASEVFQAVSVKSTWSSHLSFSGRHTQRSPCTGWELSLVNIQTETMLACQIVRHMTFWWSLSWYSHFNNRTFCHEKLSWGIKLSVGEKNPLDRAQNWRIIMLFLSTLTKQQGNTHTVHTKPRSIVTFPKPRSDFVPNPNFFSIAFLLSFEHFNDACNVFLSYSPSFLHITPPRSSPKAPSDFTPHPTLSL